MSSGPILERRFDTLWVQWFQLSNSYSVVDDTFKKILDLYLKAENTLDFIKEIKRDYERIDADELIKAVNAYLKHLSASERLSKNFSVDINTANRRILKQYRIKDKTIHVFTDSEIVSNLIHPALDHLETTNTTDVDVIFDIYVHNEFLHLFKNEQLLRSVPKKDYHYIQGKFIMHLLCAVHDKNEEDWIATFHGSTLTDGHNSILFVGESGKGKSTLCALLAQKGFDLLADDVTPMLSESTYLYYNPLAISIKEGAFKVLKPHIANFDDLATVNFNSSKGPIKYIPCARPAKDYYPCATIILVNYQSDSETKLEPTSIKNILETLIPDSWLSPNPVHAKQFLDWLETVSFYTLTYSNNESVTTEISQLFEKLRKPTE